jgi:hypothetical protein
MSLLKFTHQGKTWGIVRNQKCASTSILSYIAQALWNHPAQDIPVKSTIDKYDPKVYIKNNNFYNYKNKLLDCDIRIAIWRDPIEKFVSGFYHTMFSSTGAQDQLWQGPHTLDEFLENFNYYYTESQNVRDHCDTNTARLGPSQDIYTDIYYYTDADKIASMFGVETLVRMRDTKPKPELTDKQRERIVQLQYQDYINKWC